MREVSTKLLVPFDEELARLGGIEVKVVKRDELIARVHD